MCSENPGTSLGRRPEKVNQTRIDQAVSTFSSGFNCAESIVSAYAESLGMDRRTAIRMACGLGAGMSRMSGICGAVSGAILVLGMEFGRDHPYDEVSKEATYRNVRELCRRFEITHGSTGCANLLGVDISTDEGLEIARENDLFTNRCPRFVEEAARLIELLTTSM